MFATSFERLPRPRALRGVRTRYRASRPGVGGTRVFRPLTVRARARSRG